MTRAVPGGPQPTDGLLVERRGSGLWLRLHRPQRHNALTVRLVRALAAAVRGATDDPAVRVVVLAGSPPSFCAGGDLEDLGAVAEQGPGAVTDVVYRHFHGLVRALIEVPVPVVAAVGGPALGAGLDLALACDLRVASTSAVFASSWVTMALVPGMGGAHLLSRAVGSTRAGAMVLTAQRVGAVQALDWGLVNEVVAPGELDDRVQALVDQLAGLSAAALASSTGSLRRALSAGFEAELAVMGATQGTLLTGEGFTAAAARFRSPRHADAADAGGSGSREV